MAMTTLFRVAAWISIAALVLLTIVPPSARPVPAVPHHLEHFASFFIAGALWYLGYPRRLLVSLTLAVLFAGGLELLQMLVPGRHARFVDFAVDVIGAWTGSVAAFLFFVPAVECWAANRGMRRTTDLDVRHFPGDKPSLDPSKLLLRARAIFMTTIQTNAPSNSTTSRRSQT